MQKEQSDILKELNAELVNVFIDYIDLFEQKHDVTLDYHDKNDNWFDALWFDGYYLFHIWDIIFDLENNLPKGLILTWFEWVAAGNRYVNLKAFAGLRPDIDLDW